MIPCEKVYDWNYLSINMDSIIELVETTKHSKAPPGEPKRIEDLKKEFLNSKNSKFALPSHPGT